MNKLQAIGQELKKYPGGNQEALMAKLKGREINLATMIELGCLELHDAYMDCKSAYPELFPPTPTIENESEKIEEVNYLLWEKNKISRTYHADIKLPFNGVSDVYGLTIFKDGYSWFIMGEDHNVTDYEENLDWEGKIVGFKTLWEAKEKAEGIRQWMQNCYEKKCSSTIY